MPWPNNKKWPNKTFPKWTKNKSILNERPKEGIPYNIPIDIGHGGSEVWAECKRQNIEDLKSVKLKPLWGPPWTLFDWKFPWNWCQWSMPHCRVDICPCGPSGVLPKAQKGQKTAIFGGFRAFRAPEKIINLRFSVWPWFDTTSWDVCKKLERSGPRSALIILRTTVNLSKCFSTKNRQNRHALTQQKKVAKQNFSQIN